MGVLHVPFDASFFIENSNFCLFIVFRFCGFDVQKKFISLPKNRLHHFVGQELFVVMEFIYIFN